MIPYKMFTFALLATLITLITGSKIFHKIKRSTPHGHDLHKDRVTFLGEEAAREFYGLTEKESIRRLR